jgi:hypothetical protein
MEYTIWKLEQTGSSQEKQDMTKMDVDYGNTELALM